VLDTFFDHHKEEKEKADVKKGISFST